MSGIEMKNFTNFFCRLIGNLRDSEFICHEFIEDALQIKASIHKMMLRNTSVQDVFIDENEVEKLRKENEEMKSLLADYHRGVELLMTAYRQRVLNNIQNEQTEATQLETELFDETLFKTIIEQSEQIYQMHNAMRLASNANDEAEYLFVEQMAFLCKENEILKELYKASQKFGTAQYRLRFNELSLREMGVQTDSKIDETQRVLQIPMTCSEKPWEHFEQWKQQSKFENNSKVETEEEDKITVVAFPTQQKSEVKENIKQKNFSTQAYTF